jgi:hypothetical protein
VNSAPIEANTYTDTSVTGGTTSYHTAKAVGLGDVESANPTEVSSTVQ